ncbi:inactive ubiquitin carboxyl-terminal hydrolase MINDY-4B-like isoform X2 [Lycorma delicatula]
MYPRNVQRALSRTAVSGGNPITEQLACELRTIVFGTSTAPPRGEWLRTGFTLNNPEKELGFGLKTTKNGTRGLASVIQAYMIKLLLFEKRETTLTSEELLKPSRARQIEVMTTAMAEILWKISEQSRVVVLLPQEKCYIQHSLNYFQDSITEKLHVFEFTSVEDIQIFLKRYLYLFLDEPGPGCLLFLYSAVATRGTSRIEKDLEGSKGYLVTAQEEGSECIVTLLLCGRATPYLHNGVVYVGDEEHYAVPQFGILNRNEVGFLIFEEKVDEESRVPGSRLKTPSLPVWVISCLGHYGVIFNTNRELLRNYHAERRFELYYYSCGGSYSTMTVDTRQSTDEADGLEVQEEELVISTNNNIEKVIFTKWQDANITWHGSVLFT